MEPDSLTLSPVEAASPLWLKIQSHYDGRLRELRVKNDGLLPEDRRNLLIGQISEVKRLLESGIPPPRG